MHLQAFSLPQAPAFYAPCTRHWALYPTAVRLPRSSVCKSATWVLESSPPARVVYGTLGAGRQLHFWLNVKHMGKDWKFFFRFFSIVSLHIEKVFQFSILVLQSFLGMGASWEIQRSQPAGLRICNVLEDLYFYFWRIPSFASICNEW